MKSLFEIRKKTGLSQQALADYLDISRSLVNMAEQGLRDLPVAALIKLADIEKLTINTGMSNKQTPEDQTLKKLKSHHQKKMENYLFKAKMLQRRLAVMLRSNEKGKAKLKFIDELAKNKETGKKNFDEHWLEYHEHTTRKKMLKKADALYLITIDIEVQLEYAAVHEKILGKLV